MIIAHITDIHITSDLQSLHDVDVVANFERILDEIERQSDITHVVLTGDLCAEEGRLSTMHWVKAHLESLGLPFFVIPGNHDDSVIMAQVFDQDHYLHGDEFYYNVVIGDRHLIFLDTAKGGLTVDQISWLKAIDRMQQEPSLIFMHHPPVDAVPYMDRHYPMADKPEFQNVLRGLINVQAVFCGHYHVEKTVKTNGLPPVYITPSTFFQIDSTVEEFKVGTKRIAWRCIDWSDPVRVRSEVRWLDPA